MNPYDASKSCADLLARAFHSTYGLPVAVTRCANLYGPGDMNFSRIVPATLRSVIEGERPIIRSDGSPQRDYLYVKDAADAYLTLAQAVMGGTGGGRAYNLGTGVPVTVLELVDQIIAAAGSDLTPDVQGTAASEIQNQYLDPTLAREELGWEARTPLAQGLAEAYQWYRGYCCNHA
jgi:CDP-glucose 4,6-dehydratase